MKRKQQLNLHFCFSQSQHLSWTMNDRAPELGGLSVEKLSSLLTQDTSIILLVQISAEEVSVLLKAVQLNPLIGWMYSVHRVRQ